MGPFSHRAPPTSYDPPLTPPSRRRRRRRRSLPTMDAARCGPPPSPLPAGFRSSSDVSPPELHGPFLRRPRSLINRDSCRGHGGVRARLWRIGQVFPGDRPPPPPRPRGPVLPRPPRTRGPSDPSPPVPSPRHSHLQRQTRGALTLDVRPPIACAGFPMNRYIFVQIVPPTPFCQFCFEQRRWHFYCFNGLSNQ